MIRIGIVNDLRLAVESLRRAVATVPGATVAWVAEDGAQAVARCAEDRPDVVLMDMIMPVMDGVEATRRIMRATPCPILVVTATVEGNAARVFEALGAGALDAVATPGLGPDGASINAEPLARKIRAIGLIAGAGAGARPVAAGAAGGHGAPIAPMVVIGASTGGPQALATVLRSLRSPLAWPVLIVQHIDPMFAPGLAEWLSRESGTRVEPARPGDAPSAACILIGATTDHMVLDRAGRIAYTPEPTALVYRPSVDVFFDSICAAGATPGVAVVLTGMGRDGAAGLLRLRQTGWHTIAQDKDTSVVWGMPGAAVELGAAAQTLPIGDIGHAISLSMISKASATPRTP